MKYFILITVVLIVTSVWLAILNRIEIRRRDAFCKKHNAYTKEDLERLVSELNQEIDAAEKDLENGKQEAMKKIVDCIDAIEYIQLIKNKLE